MKALILFVAAALLPMSAPAGDERGYTPKVGSPERKAICDVMRAYARKEYGDLEKEKFLWKIEDLKVLGKYAAFGGTAVNPDGSYFEHGSMIGDWFLDCYLRRDEGGWKVIEDLTCGGDPPAAAEIAAIRAKFPKEIPQRLLR